MLSAEVISIGDELTSGQRLDTNSQWLSERLGELGVRVLYHTTVADDLEANLRVFRAAVERADLVVATGGLGPTADDLTREALARVAGVELVLDEPSLAYIQSLFARRKRDMPERNKIQAYFPQGSRPIPNPQGTAPGIDLEIPRCEGAGACRVMALPGVPAEMKEMWEQWCAPQISLLHGQAQVIRHRRIKCFGVGESDLEQMLPDLIRRGREPQVGITVSGATITLRITSAAATMDEWHRSIEPTVATIHQCLGTLVFGEEEDELEHAVARLLAVKRKSLAVVEWGTGGLIAQQLADVVDPPELLRTSLAARNGLLLPLPRSGNQAAPPAANSEPEAWTRQAAEWWRTASGADLCLAVGPFPEFDPDSPEPKPAYFALSTPRGSTVKSSPFAGHPSILKVRAAKQALNLARLWLLQSGDQSGG